VNWTWRHAVVVGTALAVLAGGVVLTAGSGASGGRDDASPVPRPSGPLVSAPTASRGNAGPGYGSEIGRPTGTAAQSKVWFADGSWWGGLYVASAGEWRIHWFEWSTQRWRDTGTLLDERGAARIDVLYDGTSVVVVGGGHQEDDIRDSVRVSRFRYDDGPRQWALEAGYPVTVVPNGVTDPAVVRDTTGALWLSYVAGGNPFVVRSTGGDRRWGNPVVLPAAAAGRTEQAAVAAYGTAVGVMWTEQEEDAVHVATHVDGAPPGDWEAGRVDVPGRGRSGNAIVLRGVPAAREEPATLLAAVQTLPEPGQPRNQLGPGLVLLEGGAQSGWRSSRVTAIQDGPGAPALAVDAGNRRVHVVTVSRSSPGAMFLKSAKLDDLVFPAGPGTQLAAGRSPTGSRLQDPSSSKQPLDAASGLLVLAADEGRAEYLMGASALGGADLGTPSEGDERHPDGAIPAEVLVEDFQTSRPGAALDPVWRIRSDDTTAGTSIVERGPAGALAGRITTGTSARSARVCRSVGVVTGDLVSDVDVMLDGPSVRGAVLASVRGDREVAGVRITGGGRLAWWQGAEQAQSDLRPGPGTWYRITTTVHVPTKTWGFVLYDRLSGAILVALAGLPWRDARDSTVEEVCFETPDGVGAGLVIDNLRVLR
jgi:hypothetical protein